MEREGFYWQMGLTMMVNYYKTTSVDLEFVTGLREDMKVNG
jgi:hypothetical protein